MSGRRPCQDTSGSRRRGPHRKEVARLPRAIRPLVALAAFAAAIALPGMTQRRRGHMISWS